MNRGGYSLPGRLVLLVVLAAAVVWVVQLRCAREVSPDGESGALIPILGDLERVTFVSGADSVMVEVGGEEAWMVHPIRDRVDPFFMAELRRLLESIRPNRVLQDLVAAEAGLSPARASVLLETAEGRAFSVELGDTVPIGSQIYARVRPGPQAIILLDLFPVRRYLTPEPEVLRDKRAVILGGGPVDSVAVVVPETSLRARRLRADLWESRIPPGVRLDPPSINRVIQDLRAPSIQGFPSGAEDLRDLGLQPPRAVWVLYQRSRAESVLVGRRTPDGMSVHILPAGRARPALLDAELEDELTGGWPALAGLSLFDTAPEEWTSVRFLGAADSIAYVREDGRWLRAPQGEALERPGAMARDVENLGRLRWRRYPWPEVPPPSDQERLTLEVRTAASAETLELAAPRDSLGWARSSSRAAWGRITPLTWRIWSYRAGW